MLKTTETIRAARRVDAAHLARLVNIAGDGMPLAHWRTLGGPQDDPWTIGAERAARDTGGFSWRNATMAEIDGQVAAAMIAYRIDSKASPEDYANLPPDFIALQELEDEAVGSHYVNVLAAYGPFRGRGLGTRLLRHARRVAGSRPMSLIVSDANAGARRLYEREGFQVRADRPAGSNSGLSGHGWLLMMT